MDTADRLLSCLLQRPDPRGQQCPGSPKPLPENSTSARSTGRLRSTPCGTPEPHRPGGLLTTLRRCFNVAPPPPAKSDDSLRSRIVTQIKRYYSLREPSTDIRGRHSSYFHRPDRRPGSGSGNLPTSTKGWGYGERTGMGLLPWGTPHAMFPHRAPRATTTPPSCSPVSWPPSTSFRAAGRLRPGNLVICQHPAGSPRRRGRLDPLGRPRSPAARASAPGGLRHLWATVGVYTIRSTAEGSRLNLQVERRRAAVVAGISSMGSVFGQFPYGLGKGMGRPDWTPLQSSMTSQGRGLPVEVNCVSD